MMRLNWVLVGLVALGLTACGGGDNDTILLGNDPEAALDQTLTAMCDDAGVTRTGAPLPEHPALVELGRALFFDKELSGNRNISCATCHHPVAGTGDSLPVSIGEGGVGLGATRVQAGGHLIPRNAPHVWNGGVTGVDSMFWDSRLTRDPTTGVLTTPEPGLNGASPTLADHALPLTSALAAQAMFPVTSTEEMRGTGNEVASAPDNAGVWAALMARLVGTNNGAVGGIAEYRSLFLAAFPSTTNFDDLTFGHAAQAIAAFERDAFTALDTPFDRFLAGETSALSPAAKRGAILFFGEARCGECHNGPMLSDFEHYAIAAPQVGPGKHGAFEDLGLGAETLNPADNYKFRVPSLRNVALNGPWMHSGAYTTLEGAVRHHLDPATALDTYDPTQLPLLFEPTFDMNVARNDARKAAIDPILDPPVMLTDAEIADLMAFLYSLTDPSSLNTLHEIPDSVPSGLPVQD
ncbi:MAG: cytochrome c peroxidase [Planctomycetota bacterium]|nr:cytochrome c peroxidase [Planctomycetota bacterium]